MKPIKVLLKQLDAIVKEVDYYPSPFVRELRGEANHHFSFAALWFAVDDERSGTLRDIIGRFGNGILYARSLFSSLFQAGHLVKVSVLFLRDFAQSAYIEFWHEPLPESSCIVGYETYWRLRQWSEAFATVESDDGRSILTAS